MWIILNTKTCGWKTLWTLSKAALLLSVSSISDKTLLAMPMYGKTFSLQSPNKRLQVEVVSDGTLTWNIRHDGREVMRPSQIDINNAYQG